MSKTLEIYHLRCQGRVCRALVSTTPDGITGCIDIPTPSGIVRVAVRMSKETIRAMISKMAPFIKRHILEEDAADDEIITSGGWDDVDVSGRRSRRKARRRRRRARWKKRMKKLFSGKVVKKLGKVANKVLNNKFVRGAMKFAKFIPGYGQAIGAAYKVASKAAKVASNLGKGKRGAKQAVHALRRVAARRATPHQRRMASSLFQGFQGFQGVRRNIQALRGRSSGIDAYTAEQMLHAVGRAYLNRYGSDLEAIARQGSTVSGADLDIVVGAAALWGDIDGGHEVHNELDAEDRGVEVGRSRRSKRRARRRKRFRKFLKFTTPPGILPGVSGVEIVGAEDGGYYGKVMRALYHKGYTPNAPLREAYADGLRALA